MKILVRHLVKELVVPLIVWVTFLFLLILVMQFLRVTDVIFGSAVSSADVGRLTLYLAPHFLVTVIPVAFLLAVLLGLGRLNEDRELIAMQSLGFGQWQILAVPVAISLALGSVMLVLSLTAEPWGLTAVKGIINEMVKKNIAGDVKAGAFYQDLYWTNVLVNDDRDPSAPLLVLAREGYVNPAGSAEALKLVLSDGDLHLSKSASPDYTIVSFERGELVVGVENSLLLKNRLRSPKDELMPGELLRAARAASAQGEDPRPFLVAYHHRFGEVLTPVSFALIGAPLAMSRRRTGRAAGYLFTLLGYIAYYVISRMFENLGSQGKLPVLAATQLHNLIFAAIGLWIFSRISRAGLAR